MPALSEDQVAAFVEDGFVRVPGAFPKDLAAECREILWRDAGADPGDPATWARPVVRLGGYGSAPFRRAAGTPVLRGAYDRLVGAGRWVPREGLGTFPIRFPHPDDPDDAGWHMDAGADGRVGLRSPGRALLMLFLFTDVDEVSAPTRIKVGSHLDVPPFLTETGDGVDMFELCATMDAAGRLDAPDRPVALATGEAGDVYLCHPFLIHGAQAHRGTAPRIIAQPPLIPAGLLDLDRADGAYSPVELAVRRALRTGGP